MQVVAAAPRQACRVAGADWPAATAVQCPSRPVRLHCQQLPAQAESQQTPSTQKPVEQSELAKQADARG
jgi:hypothetical protein